MAPDWFLSDTHFGHAKIIEYSRRPFASVEEMDAELIRRYQSCVQPHHVVMFVGDVFLCTRERAAEIMKQLPGHKYVVLGNHDWTASSMIKVGFEWAGKESTTRFPRGRWARVRHRPIVDCENWMPVIHGHTHSLNRRDREMIHVGVDAWNYYPVARQDVEDLLEVAYVESGR